VSARIHVRVLVCMCACMRVNHAPTRHIYAHTYFHAGNYSRRTSTVYACESRATRAREPTHTHTHPHIHTQMHTLNHTRNNTHSNSFTRAHLYPIIHLHAHTSMIWVVNSFSQINDIGDCLASSLYQCVSSMCLSVCFINVFISVFHQCVYQCVSSMCLLIMHFHAHTSII